ncbi:unnamed protein product [Orchesella dallaii]|uniref:hydroxyisourate hydrolase n=1 Tax=Orchesella dallaii TaxID=48710 RepID=A0ABP1RNZ4_9HEXA
MFSPAWSLVCFALFFLMDHPSQLESTEITERTERNSSQEFTSSVSSIMSANENPLTSHVLDTAIGRPAVGVPVTLSKYENDQWRNISKQLTNSDGRVGNMISSEEFSSSRYKLTFETLSYYDSRGEKTFYPYIEVIFEIETPEEHFHVPILLSAYRFSTYRGS